MASAAVGFGHPKELRKQKEKRLPPPKITASPRSKMLKLPDIAKSGAALTSTMGGNAQNSTTLSNKDAERNPFHMPSDVEVFAMAREDRRVKQQAKEAMKNLSIYDKNTFYNGLRKRDADKFLVNRQTRADRHFGKENLHDFIAKKRECFFVRKMRKLEEIAQAEEQKLLDDEKALEEDAAKFDAFLKENDRTLAEMETKAKLEKIQEIKKLNVNIMSIRSDMSKNEDQLKDLQRYRHFLEKLTPKEFMAQRNAERKAANTKLGGNSKRGADREATTGDDSTQPASGGAAATSADQGDQTEDAGADEEFLDYDEEPVLFFQLEENNLALIQNCQETEETLEELKAKISETTAKMESETASLNQQIEFLNAAIAREEEKARMLEERAKMFTTGIVGAESQEKLLEDLNHKVKEYIELMPPEKVEQAEKIKDKERRQRLREEKMEAQRALQEERVQRALERARAPVKKKTGKPVVFRSPPPQKKKKKEEDNKKKEEDDLEYFWS
ncbi:hypothetical protein BC831DRAFT_465496 [Entophlyctis helioformis]|nr:hypothetical protein BC831DRAFT_465496 [Entophlyctis helioformis]